MKNQSAPEKIATFEIGIKLKFSKHIQLVIRLVIVQEIRVLKQNFRNNVSKYFLVSNIFPI